MKTHSHLLLIAVIAVASLTGLAVSSRASAATKPETPSGAEAIARGRYLVHCASMCVDCHTPRNEKGELIVARLLTGAPLGFAPAAPMPWNPVAPRIAGLPPGFTREDTVHFLMTGQRPNGRPAPLPPMPRYRFDRADAEAITAYLESLPASNG